jgi:sulfur carrier protein ThiS
MQGTLGLQINKDKQGKTIRDLIIENGLSPEVCLAKINGTFRPLETKLKSGDKLEIIKIVFGG